MKRTGRTVLTAFWMAMGTAAVGLAVAQPEEVPVIEVLTDDFVSWVTVGDAGNEGELSGEGAGGFGADRICGRVDYVYHIGKYEVTNREYCALLNAVASRKDPHGLYNPGMGADTFGGILRVGAPGDYSYIVKTGMEKKPVNYVSFYDACRFANWLHNGRGKGGTETGAYALDGVTNPANDRLTRRLGARIVIPSEDEWYKAAYYKCGNMHVGYWDHATQSDEPPKCELPPGGPGSANCMTVGRLTDVGAYVKSPGPYGTFDQCGNVWEWNEAILGKRGQYRAARGGCFGSMDHAADRTHKPTYWEPTLENRYIGFRVAEVPPEATVHPKDRHDAKQILDWLKRHPKEAEWILKQLQRSRKAHKLVPEEVTPMSSPHVGGQLAVHDGKLSVWVSVAGGGHRRVTEVYDPATNRPTPLGDAPLAVIDGRVYFTCFATATEQFTRMTRLDLRNPGEGVPLTQAGEPGSSRLGFLMEQLDEHIGAVGADGVHVQGFEDSAAVVLGLCDPDHDPETGLPDGTVQFGRDGMPLRVDGRAAGLDSKGKVLLRRKTKKAGVDLRTDPAKRAEVVRVEGVHDDGAGIVPDERDEPSVEPVDRLSGRLDLDRERHFARDQLHHLFERRNALARELPVEPSPGVQRLQLRQRHPAHRALAVRRSLDALVVNDHDLVVLRDVDVELERVHAEFERGLETHEGVLGILLRPAPMSDNDHFLSFSFFSSRLSLLASTRLRSSSSVTRRSMRGRGQARCRLSHFSVRSRFIASARSSVK